MNCLTGDKTCLNYTQTKPYYEINIINDKNNKYCSNLCKHDSIKHFATEEIIKNMYIEKMYEECPLCSTYDNCLIELTCHHKLCHGCMVKTFDTSSKCPICRTIIIMKSENDKMSDYYIESITNEHSYLIDTFYKLVNSIDYEYDKDLLITSYYTKTNRNIENDINLLKDYLLLFKF